MLMLMRRNENQAEAVVKAVHKNHHLLRAQKGQSGQQRRKLRSNIPLF